MVWQTRYTDEFVKKFRELGYGQQSLVKYSIKMILSLDDPTVISHHLERQSYFCNWSHRVRANLIIVFRISKRNMTFISTGTHSQAYRASSLLESGLEGVKYKQREGSHEK